MTSTSTSFNTVGIHPTNSAFSQIRKESLDIYNRLHSIEKDIEFVNQVHAAYPQYPLLPNLRCGAWYADPAIVKGQTGAYFKSTDGHYGAWSFNLRRPNLHLLPVAVSSSGIVLVDSTRSGKRMPDALSKTVPIWCAVVNRAVCLRYPELAENWDTALYTPPSVVTKNEHEQIEKLLNNWAQDLQGSSYTIPKLTRPLRPIWLTPASSRFPDFSDNSQPFTPILCVSASRCIDEGMDRRSEGFVYIQGSGDDHELWGMGLTPNVFWKHRDIILSADRANIDSVIAAVVVEAKEDNGALRKPTAIQKVGGRLIVCSVNDLPDKAQSTEVDTALLLVTRGDKITGDGNPHFLSLVTPEGKKGQSYFLQSIIPQALAFIDRQLNLGACVCVACDDGKDLSIGIAVVALQRFFDEDGNFVGSNAAINPDKRTIRKRLEWIIADRPEANPSRATLKRVNEFLMSPAFIRPPAT